MALPEELIVEIQYCPDNIEDLEEFKERIEALCEEFQAAYNFTEE